MSTNIRLKRSGNPGSVPETLLFGEVAINYNDGKFFYKNTSNEIVTVKLIRDIVGQSNQIGITESNGIFSLSLTNSVNIDTLNLSKLFVDNIEIDTTSSQLNQILQFNGTKYTPVNPNAINISLNDLSDVIITSPISGQKLFYNGSSWINEIESTGEPIGHTNKAQSVMSFDKTTRTFSITPSGASFEVWCAGKRFAYTTMQSVQIPSTSGLYYIYFSSNGVLSQKTTFFTWDQDSPTAYIYWNNDDGEAYFFADERHGITLDWQTHEYLHRTRGAAYASGFSIGAYTITGTGAANADMQLDIADGTFFDEDLQVDITHSSSPTANTWQQVLQGGAEIPIFYRSGSVWKRTTPTKYPIKQGTRAQYNLNTAGTWSTPDLATNKYGVTWIVATNNLNYPVIGIMGQNQYDNLNKVHEDTWAALDLANLPIFEIRPLWKVAYLVSSGFANTPKAAIREVVDLRVVGSTATGLLTTPTDHGSLYGLSDDDHTQYFNQTRGDARYLQLTGGSLSGALSVTGTVSGTTFSGSGASLTSIPAAQLTGTVDSARLSGAYTGITGLGTLVTGTTWSTAGWVPTLRATSGLLLEPSGANTQRWLIGNGGDGNLYIGRNTASDGSQAADYRMYMVYNGPVVINPTLTVSGGSISLNNATSNLIQYANTGVAAPTLTTRSAGTKVVLWDGVNASNVDYAIGIDGNTLWSSVPGSGQQFRWYGGTTNIATLSGGGTFTANRFTSNNSLILNSPATVNPSSNVYLTGPSNDRDAWIYRDGADTSSNWGIYHRQIDSTISGSIPGNAIGFVGGGSSLVQAYIGLADGSAFFRGNEFLYGGLYINNASPTIYLQDTDNRSGVIHQNSSIMYFLNGSGVNSTTWTAIPAGAVNAYYALTLNLDNNQATLGGDTTVFGNILAAYKNIAVSPGTTIVGGQVSARRNGGSAGVGATSDWYTDASFYASTGDVDSQVGKTASISFHPGAVAPQLRVGYSNIQIYVRGANGADNYPLTASAFNVASTKRIKKNITTWPNRSAGATSPSAVSLLENLRVVTFDRDEKAHRSELPIGRRLEAFHRLRRYQESKGLPIYELPEHDCAIHGCTGTVDDPCARKVNTDHLEYGLIAEEVVEIFPETVNFDEGKEPESINYSMLTAISIAAIKELAERIAILESQDSSI
jgi:hypothetical protein